MQKFLIASAVLAVSVAAQTDIVCQVAVDPAGELACENNAVIKSPPTDVTLTGDSKDLLFATITYTPAGTAPSCAEAATLIEQACADAITVGVEATEDEKKCLDAAATQGASAACGVDEGEDCSTAIFCADPFTCNSESKCEAAPEPSGEIICQITTAAAGTPECTGVAADITPTVTWTGGDATRKFATITTAETTCAAAATSIDQTCATAIAVGADATEDEKKCLASNAAQGASTACGVDEGEDCTAAIFCADSLICGDEGKCEVAPEPSGEIVCQITNAVPATDECTDIAVNYALPTGITLTGESKDHIFATITTTKATCDEAKADIAAACESAIVILGAPSADEAVCLADGAKQGVKKVCSLPNDATCTTTDFCENFDKCSAQNKCAADDQPQPTKVKYVWSNIPSTDKAELVTKIAELFPAKEAANFVALQGAPCAGLGLTFEVGKIYPEQKIAFVTASDAVPEACLKTVTDLKVPTAAQVTCETTCGADLCKCEEGEACIIDAQGKSNCLDGLSCKTDGTDGATTGTCNTGVMASAALAVAAALLAVLF